MISVKNAFRDLLIEADANVMAYDPHVLSYPNVEIEKDMGFVVKDADAVVILTGHFEYFNLDPAGFKPVMGKDQPVVVDGRNVIMPEEY